MDGGNARRMEPQEMWEQAMKTTEQLERERAQLHEENAAREEAFQHRDAQLVAMIDAGNSVMKTLANWGPATKTMPSPDPSPAPDPYSRPIP